MPAQFNNAGQLAPILAGLANRKSSHFIYGEHGGSLDRPDRQEQAGCYPTLFRSEFISTYLHAPPQQRQLPIMTTVAQAVLKCRWGLALDPRQNGSAPGPAARGASGKTLARSCCRCVAAPGPATAP